MSEQIDRTKINEFWGVWETERIHLLCQATDLDIMSEESRRLAFLISHIGRGINLLNLEIEVTRDRFGGGRMGEHRYAIIVSNSDGTIVLESADDPGCQPILQGQNEYDPPPGQTMPCELVPIWEAEQQYDRAAKLKAEVAVYKRTIEIAAENLRGYGEEYIHIFDILPDAEDQARAEAEREEADERIP